MSMSNIKIFQYNMEMYVCMRYTNKINTIQTKEILNEYYQVCKLIF